jgi:hypothetical protein
MPLERAEHDLVRRVAAVEKAVADRRLHQRDRLRILERHLGAQQIGDEPPQAAAIQPAQAFRREGDIGVNRRLDPVCMRELQDAAPFLRLRQGRRLRESVPRADREIGLQHLRRFSRKVAGDIDLRQIDRTRAHRHHGDVGARLAGQMLSHQRLHLRQHRRHTRIGRRAAELLQAG